MKRLIYYNWFTFLLHAMCVSYVFPSFMYAYITARNFKTQFATSSDSFSVVHHYNPQTLFFVLPSLTRLLSKKIAHKTWYIVTWIFSLLLLKCSTERPMGMFFSVFQLPFRMNCIQVSDDIKFYITGSRTLGVIQNNNSKNGYNYVTISLMMTNKIKVNQTEFKNTELNNRI